jgi:diaminohydroxyphosphoribosylaminopyrimidine deaminase / 5-amino-6-(5-phosphoribosylamino)uracil reductase
MRQDRDEQYMAMCLRLAKKGKGYVSPNPLVGAVLVKNGRVVAHGYHHRFGGPHAEVECLRRYKGILDNTTLYVNLEPCAHQGKTPPCADLIIESGIPSVVVGMKDPNPLVSGKGIRKLRRAGISVTTAVLQQRAIELNRIFVTNMTKQRPFIHVKIAQTLDGIIALHQKSPTKITCLESQRLVHEWRAEHDAILVGAGTIRSDNPSLTVRLAEGRDPAVVILDNSLSVSSKQRILMTAHRRRVILFVRDRAFRQQRRKVRELTSLGVTVIPIKSTKRYLPLRRIMRELYQMNIVSVLVEGGSAVFGQFRREGLFDMLSIFVSPVVFGSGVPAFAKHVSSGFNLNRGSRGDLTVREIGSDALLQYNFN